jgi:hypothetical protein
MFYKLTDRKPQDNLTVIGLKVYSFYAQFAKNHQIPKGKKGYNL